MRLESSSPRVLAAGGAALSALCLAVAVLRPEIGLRAWLAAGFFWSAVPIGAVALLMMIRLIPGVWTAELARPMESLAGLLPLAALVFLPILLGAGALYPWSGAPGGGAFRQVYLTHSFFALRTVLFFALLIGLAFMLAQRRWSVPVASLGLIGYVLLGTATAVDWLLSLDPGFHSSGFGLYVLSIEMTIALMAALAIATGSGAPLPGPGVLGGLVITALLISVYLAFMQYFITWSDNLLPGVSWYQRRGGGVWAAVEIVIGGLELAPLALLLAPDVRAGRRWLFGLAIAVLAGKALECAWLVLPGAPQPGWGLAVLTLAAFAGIGLLFGAALVTLGRFKPLRVVTASA